MKVYKKLLLLPVLLIAFAFSGCSKEYFDINQNPNNPTEESITPSSMLSNAELRVANYTTLGPNSFYMWLGYWARTGNYGPNSADEQYEISTNNFQWRWETAYDILKNLNTIEIKGKELGMPQYEGIAKILKALIYGQVVDQYNDAIYSEAFNVEIIYPKYDKAETIYMSLLTELDVADKLLKESKEPDQSITTNDVIFHGEVDSWRRFGNTIALRLIMHMTEIKSVSDLKALVAKVVGNGAGFMEDEDALVHLPFKNDDGKQSPFWSLYGWKANANKDEADKFNCASDFFINELKSKQDPRISQFFSPVGNKPGGDYKGAIFGRIDQEYKDETTTNQVSRVSGPGLAKSPSAPALLFAGFQSLFIQAEAAQRGIIDGDAKVLYEKAVRSSFVQLEVERYDSPSEFKGERSEWTKKSIEAADAYMEDERSEANWDKATDKISLILNQKRIALCGTDIVEVWNDYRRAGKFDIPISVHPSNSKKIPHRLIYPQSETNGNSENCPKNLNHQARSIFWEPSK